MCIHRYLWPTLGRCQPPTPRIRMEAPTQAWNPSLLPCRYLGTLGQSWSIEVAGRGPGPGAGKKRLNKSSLIIKRDRQINNWILDLFLQAVKNAVFPTKCSVNLTITTRLESLFLLGFLVGSVPLFPSSLYWPSDLIPTFLLLLLTSFCRQRRPVVRPSICRPFGFDISGSLVRHCRST